MFFPLLAMLLAAPCEQLAIRVTPLPTAIHWGEPVQVSISPAGKFARVEWRLQSKAIEDFDEQITDAEMARTGWKVQFLPTLLRNREAFTLYFLPTHQPAQIEDRTITLRAREIATGQWRQCQKALQILPHPRPVELYTSDHPAKAANRHQGRVIDTHFRWHFFHSLALPSMQPHPSFLHWHHLFVSRYQEWRKLFGYPPLLPWKPAPHTPELIELKGDNFFSSNQVNAGFTVPAFPDPKAFAASKQFSAFEEAIVDAHDTVHARLQDCPGRTMPFGCFLGVSSPKSEIFWRFHLYLDELYTAYCPQTALRPSECPSTGLN